MKRIALALASLTLAAPLVSQTIQISKDNRTIAITTSDEASALADTAEISIGYILYGTEKDATYADGSRASNAINKALLDAGVKSQQIESRDQTLNPLDDEDKLRFGKGLRFRIAQHWKVTVGAQDAATILNIAVQVGANDSGSINWRLQKDGAVQAEAAEKALAQAREIADHMARGLHAKLGNLIYASNQTPPRGLAALLGNGMVLNTENAALGTSTRNLISLKISPESITKSATVYAVFALE